MAESKVIIIGANGHEYARIKPKNKGKRYFETKKQLYRVYPEGYSRMKIVNIDGTVDYAECVIYEENCLTPYFIANESINYDADAFEEDIWLDKQESSAYMKKHLSWSNVGSFFEKYGKALPIVLVVGVVAVAFIGQFLGV